MQQQWTCSKCLPSSPVNNPDIVPKHCPRGGVHHWIKYVVTQEMVNYHCEYCRSSFNTQKKTLTELRHCDKPSPSGHHKLIKTISPKKAN